MENWSYRYLEKRQETGNCGCGAMRNLGRYIKYGGQE